MVKYPEDWKVVPIGEVGSFYKGSGICRADSNTGNLPAVRYGELYTDHNDYVKRYRSHISAVVARSSVCTKRGDVVFAASGETEAEIGKCAAICDDGVYAGGDLICFRPNEFEDPRFWGLMLNTPEVQRQKTMAAQGATVVHIRTAALSDLKVPLPPLPEQKRIAAVLGNVDKLIDNLSRRIEKKRLVKQGVMQDLLTAKKRLPGFKGEWKRVKLGEVATMFSGGTPTAGENQFYGGSIPWASISDMTAAGKFLGDTEKKLTQLGFDSCSAKMYPANTLLFAMYASIGKCCIANKPVCSSQAILGIYNLEDIDLEFLYQVLHSRETEFASMGQTGTQSNLSKQIVEKIEVDVPTLAEQKAIAGVLGAMDGEIAKLEAKLEKYRSLKQGLMNDLLTGRVRV